MYSLVVLLPFLFSVIGIASPLRSEYAVKESHPTPNGWVQTGDAPKDGLIKLHIGLKQADENAIEDHLLAISDPKHHRYKQYLSVEEITNLTRPSQRTRDHVIAWLDDHGLLQHISSDIASDWVTADVTIGQAEQLLQTKYSSYAHVDGIDTIDRAEHYSLPRHLHEHIDVIHPTTAFFRSGAGPSRRVVRRSDDHSARLQARAANDSISAVCKNDKATPDCIRTLYGTIDYKPQVPGKNKIAINNFLNQSSHRRDTALYLNKFRPEAVAAADEFKIVIINDAENMQGAYNKSDPDYYEQNIEGNLDAQTSLVISWPTPLTAYNTGGLVYFDSKPFSRDSTEPFLTWLNYMRTQSDIPQVVSTSYGDNEDWLPPAYARRVCKGFAELGARGVSLFFSSGDTGVASREGSCRKPNGHFVPHFPASCPWVTAVGGTHGFQPERAFYASGGGFSNYFARPSYQDNSTAPYIASLNGHNAGRFNAQGRGYPDVAAQADHVSYAQAGRISTGYGTSASAPIFAATIALVNDALIAKGEPVMGFLNPWLYAGGYEALTDVTEGHSEGCHTKGFPAREGWDAITGWGTPDFKKLVRAACAR